MSEGNAFTLLVRPHFWGTLLSGPRSLASLWSHVLSGGYPSLWSHVLSQGLGDTPVLAGGVTPVLAGDTSVLAGGTPVLAGGVPQDRGTLWPGQNRGTPQPGQDWGIPRPGLGYPPWTGYAAGDMLLADFLVMYLFGIVCCICAARRKLGKSLLLTRSQNSDMAFIIVVYK